MGQPPNPVSQLQQVQNVMQAPGSARYNLLTNGGFELWQRGNGAFTAYGQYAADRWQVLPTGTDTMNVQRNNGGFNGWGGSAVVTHTVGTGGGIGGLVQILKLPGEFNLAGQVVCFSAVVQTSAANAVRLQLFDATGGATIANGVAHTGVPAGSWRTLSVSGAVPPGCQALWAVVSCTATATYYVDNAMLVIGSVPTDFAPIHPADDRAHCERYYEVLGGNGNWPWYDLQSLNIQAPWIRTPLQWRVRKGGNPTLTQSGMSTLACNQFLESGNTDGLIIRLDSTVGSQTLIRYYNPDGNGKIMGEWNP